MGNTWVPVRFLALSTSIVGCAGQVESDPGHDEPFVTDDGAPPSDDRAPPIVASGTGGAPAFVPASGGAPAIIVPASGGSPGIIDPRPACTINPRVEVTTSSGTVLFDSSSSESAPPQSISLWTVQCSGGRNSDLLAFQASSGSGSAMGGAGAEPSPQASLSLRFDSDYEGGTWVVEGSGEYISPLGERFELVLDEDISGDLFESEPHLEETIRYLGTNAEGQTESLQISLSVCLRLDVCTI
jgi:hypothetical protein